MYRELVELWRFGVPKSLNRLCQKPSTGTTSRVSPRTSNLVSTRLRGWSGRTATWCSVSASFFLFFVVVSLPRVQVARVENDVSAKHPNQSQGHTRQKSCVTLTFDLLISKVDRLMMSLHRGPLVQVCIKIDLFVFLKLLLRTFVERKIRTKYTKCARNFQNIIFKISFTIWEQMNERTDGRTDERTDTSRILMPSSASLACNRHFHHKVFVSEFVIFLSSRTH